MVVCPKENPLTRQTLDGDAWLICEHFWFTWKGEGHEPIERHIYPEDGFVTDGLSIPRFYRWRFSPSGKGFRAAIGHDLLYREGIVPRDVCDRVFRDGLEFCGVGAWQRNIMYFTLRVGGGVAYGKSRRQRQAEKDAREREEA
jgi:hypothetical protein